MQYIYEKMRSQKKDTVGSVLIVACVVTILTICLQLAAKLKPVLQEQWFKRCLSAGLITDFTMKGKIEAMVTLVLVIIAIIYVFFVAIYALKQKLDIVKERDKISVFQVIGYTRGRMSVIWYAGKVVEAVIGSVAGGLLAWVMWRILQGQKTFSEFMKLANEDMGFEGEYIFINVALLLIITLPVIYWNILRNVHIMDMKGEE